jgi:hypothetical protein
MMEGEGVFEAFLELEGGGELSRLANCNLHSRSHESVSRVDGVSGHKEPRSNQTQALVRSKDTNKPQCPGHAQQEVSSTRL